jgi:internalin A
MRHALFILCLLLCLTNPLHAQDEPTPYDIALQRIQYAAAAGATELNLSWLGLTGLPSELWQLTNLQTLDLYGNELTGIPLEIGQLTNLQGLYLHGNQLTGLPPEIGQLTNLQYLTLYDNQLTGLPPEIGQLTNLQYLTLYDNQLRHLPTELGNLISLTCADTCYLELANNPLISPPPAVVEQGTAAVLAYLRNQAWYHLQRLIIAGAGGIGLLALLMLGLRYRQNRRKPKAKRGE